MPNPTCATCQHWQADARASAYSAPCAKGYGKTPYDGTCQEHEAPKPDMQSQARGVSNPYMGASYWGKP